MLLAIPMQLNILFNYFRSWYNSQTGLRIGGKIVDGTSKILAVKWSSALQVTNVGCVNVSVGWSVQNEILHARITGKGKTLNRTLPEEELTTHRHIFSQL